jgi:hypothetical protein
MKETFDAKSALAAIKADKKPKRGRKKGSRNGLKNDYPPEVDPERIQLIKETIAIYEAEGYGWVIQENPREKYTTEQLRIHLGRLKQGHRPWIYRGELKVSR